MAKRNTNTRTINVTTENKFNKAGSFLMRKIAWHKKRMETTTDDKGNVIHTPSAGQIKWNNEQIALHMNRIEKLQQAEQGKRVSHDEYVRAILLPRMEAKVEGTKTRTSAKGTGKGAAKASTAPDPTIMALQQQVEALTAMIQGMTGSIEILDSPADKVRAVMDRDSASWKNVNEIVDHMHAMDVDDVFRLLGDMTDTLRRRVTAKLPGEFKLSE